MKKFDVRIKVNRYVEAVVEAKNLVDAKLKAMRWLELIDEQTSDEEIVEVLSVKEQE